MPLHFIGIKLLIIVLKYFDWGLSQRFALVPVLAGTIGVVLVDLRVSFVNCG